MHNRFLVYMFLGLAMVSCYTFNKPEKPTNLIPKNEMVNIILDLKLMSSSNGNNKRILERKGIYSEEYIYKKYRIDSSTFASSNAYYAYYVEDYDAIYTKVKDSLEALMEFYKDLEKKEIRDKRRQDSILAIKRKDSIKMLNIKDSTLIKTAKDSVARPPLKTKPKPKLIQPVSDKAAQ